MWRYRSSDALVVRKSKFAWFPHFAVLFELTDGSLVKYEYVPLRPVRKWLPPFFFEGYVKITEYVIKQKES